jgi:dihydrofolate synthase/folylpolyglutamate synthase
MRMGLDRMRHFLESIGSPHKAIPVIHVAGTNGKGSTVRMVGSMLRAAGYRVGEYTSPHLQNINERIHVDGQPISDEALNALLAEIDQSRQRWAAGLDDFVPIDRVLTYFELMTAAAFTHFANQRLDVAVVEVGMGGRLDATNVVDPVVTAITSIGLDHEDQLGNDVSAIAGEKAGIIKNGRPVVVGAMSDDALRVIRAIAHEHNANVFVNDEEWRVEPGRDGVFSWTFAGTTEHGLRTGLAGDHQMLNAGVALTILGAISDRFPIGAMSFVGSVRHCILVGWNGWMPACWWTARTMYRVHQRWLPICEKCRERGVEHFCWVPATTRTRVPCWGRWLGM